MVRAKYEYARQKLSEDVQEYLVENLDDNYRVYRSGTESIRGRTIRILTIMGVDLKPSLIIIDDFLESYLSSDLEEITQKLSVVYSEEECIKKITNFADEHELLSKELCLKLDALPSDKIKDIPEFADYSDLLQDCTSGYILPTYKFLNQNKPKLKTWLQELLGIDDKKQEKLKRILETYLGEEIISLDKELYG